MRWIFFIIMSVLFSGFFRVQAEEIRRQDKLWEGEKSFQSHHPISQPDNGWDWAGITWLTGERVCLEGDNPQTNFFAGSVVRGRPEGRIWGIYFKPFGEWYENGCQTVGLKIAPELTVGILKFAVGGEALNRRTVYNVWDSVSGLPEEKRADETIVGAFIQMEMGEQDCSPTPSHFRIRGEILPEDSTRWEVGFSLKPQPWYLYYQAEKTEIGGKDVPLRDEGTYEAREGRIGAYLLEPFLLYLSSPSSCYESKNWRVDWRDGWGIGSEIGFSSSWKLHASYKNLNRVDSDLRGGEWKKNERRWNVGVVFNW